MADFIIAPGIRDSDISSPPTFAEKIRIFHAQTSGWRLSIADFLINGWKDNAGTTHPAIPEAGFAAVAILFTYFEPIGRYLDGDCSEDKMGFFFKKGLHAVFPSIREHANPRGVKSVEDMLWKAVRCGIYHAGMTRGGIFLTGDITSPIEVPSDYKVLAINPHLLVKAELAHLESYRMNLLRSGETSEVGARFVARFDYDRRQ
jgi:hypothetical protein